MITALVLSRLDYCNNVLVDLPEHCLLQRLQAVQNAAMLQHAHLQIQTL